jgi:glycosyltransferase involved in cell wall biosynthesis
MPVSNPVVCAVMLASGREEMVARAVRCFQSQTYQNKRLLILDNGWPRLQSYMPVHAAYVTSESASIGALRNKANKFAGQLTGADIIVHWDSDDWNHPNRIAEQVALLQSSGAECVGYNEMLFWSTSGVKIGAVSGCAECGCMPCLCESSAWLYRAQFPNYAMGTSMMYWRETWQRTPFKDYDKGCDDLYWLNGDPKHGVRPVKICSESAIVAGSLNSVEEKLAYPPRMIASIHAGNTCAEIKPGVEWKRAPEWDEYCRNAMQLQGVNA